MQNVTDVTAERINIIAQQLRQRFIDATVLNVQEFRGCIVVEGFTGRFIVSFDDVNYASVAVLVHELIKDAADFVGPRADIHAMHFIANVLEMAKQGHE
jgi:hypothetical protein